MAIELQLLTYSVILGIAQVFAAAFTMTLQRGVKWNTGNRDESPAPLKGKAARLDRALQNFKETFPLFAVAILLVFIAERSNELTAFGAHLYFWARLVYVPIYAFGVPKIRSLIWLISILGIGLILSALF